eukprot:scaffold43790_cov38-Cyclotella_meneghiniana.AAC.6
MSGVPTQPSSSLPPEGEGVGQDPRRAGAFRFWRNFAQANEKGCREALLPLADIWGEEFGELEGSGSPSLGKFLMVDIPMTSPKNARDAWNSDRVTKLVLVDPVIHCLSIDGDEKKHDGGNYTLSLAVHCYLRLLDPTHAVSELIRVSIVNDSSYKDPPTW